MQLFSTPVGLFGFFSFLFVYVFIYFIFSFPPSLFFCYSGMSHMASQEREVHMWVVVGHRHQLPGCVTQNRKVLQCQLLWGPRLGEGHCENKEQLAERWIWCKPTPESGASSPETAVSKVMGDFLKQKFTFEDMEMILCKHFSWHTIKGRKKVPKTKTKAEEKGVSFSCLLYLGYLFSVSSDIFNKNNF